MTDIFPILPSDESQDRPSRRDESASHHSDAAEPPDVTSSKSDADSKPDAETILQFNQHDTDEAVDETASEGDDIGEPDELEAAYLHALEMIDEAEWEIGQALSEIQTDDAEIQADDAVIEAVGEPLDEADSLDDAAAGLVDEFLSEQKEDEHRLSPTQIIEAAMFVGGQPLTARKLAGLLRGRFDATFVELKIAQLNEQYLRDERPYEIRLNEGGYELKLRYAFEDIRHRVFGLGPKEVKLSQDALEVLSLVAYHQPMSVQEIEEAGKEKAKPTLRQLLRRELVALERGEKNRKKVKYVTTDRFLQVFGLADIEELPLLGDLDFK